MKDAVTIVGLQVRLLGYYSLARFPEVLTGKAKERFPGDQKAIAANW